MFLPTDCGGIVKKATPFVLLLVATLFWALPNPDECSLNVHVTSSYLVRESGPFPDAVPVQKLNVLIDGKKYELKAEARNEGLLALGNYKGAAHPR